MARPDFITEEDIARWTESVSEEQEFIHLTKIMGESKTLLEVCFAGLYLAEQLEKLKVPEELITRIQFTAGRLSFGRDPWKVTMMLLDKYQKNELVLADDSNKELN